MIPKKRRQRTMIKAEMELALKKNFRNEEKLFSVNTVASLNNNKNYRLKKNVVFPLQ